MKLKTKVFASLALALATFFTCADAKWTGFQLVKAIAAASEGARSVEIPAIGTVEVAFSPSEGAEELVLKVINSAHHNIRMMAYSLTNPRVTKALIKAKGNGVEVVVVADEKANTIEDRSGKSRAALSAMQLAGIDARLISAYAISHDKVLLVDDSTVQTGSFNYTDAAAKRNSENVVVHWNNPALFKVYLQHFERNLRQSRPFQTRY